MEKISLSPVGKLGFGEIYKEKEVVKKEPEQKKNGKKLLALGATALSAAAIAGIAIYKGKTKTLADIDFNLGNATLKKDGSNFTGIIKTKLSNGDKVSLEYVDGVLQNSNRTGSKNVSKFYSKNEDGEKLVKIIRDNETEVKNTTKIGKEKVDYLNWVKAEAHRRTEKENAIKLAQEKEDAYFEALKTPSKSARESAEVFEQAWKEEILEEVKRRTEKENAIKLARAKEDAYFEALKTPSKSARESAEIIDEFKKEEAQIKYNKPFESKLSNKSALESAQSLMSGCDTRKTIRFSEFDENGKIIKQNVRSKKDNKLIEKHFYDENDNVTRSLLDNKECTTRIGYNDNIKTVSSNKHKDGEMSIKYYIKDDDGKYKLARREKSSGEDYKIVEQHEDYSVTTILNDCDNTKEIIVRDKKGNILSDTKDVMSKGAGPTDPPKENKLLAAWYKNYLKLCQKYGVSPRECGKNGAWDHYYELCLRETDPEAYERYIRLQNYRAKYDLEAKLQDLLNQADYNWDMGLYIELCREMTQNSKLRSIIGDKNLIELLNKIKELDYTTQSEILEKLKSINGTKDTESIKEIMQEITEIIKNRSYQMEMQTGRIRCYV